jgi:LacI family transcriptional regulator
MTQRSNSITIRDVARAAKVSVATVSRYINHNASVSPVVSDRLEKVMIELNYVPHAAARHLASRKTHVIGLLLTNMHNDFFGPLLSGIETVIRLKGYNLIVATYRRDVDGDGERMPIGAHNSDGLLVFADSLDDRQLRQLYEKNFPVVLIHRTPPADLAIPYVTVENRDATRRLIDHLIEVHKRQSILFMRGPAHQEDSRWRETGYRASLEAHGLAFDPNLVLQGDFEREIAENSMRTFLKSDHPAFDAVFAGDDDAAIGAMIALKEAGYRIPEDVSLVGFDDQKLSAFLDPPLTTVRAPTELVGKVAGENVLALLQGLSVNPETLLSTNVILRHSCGCLDTSLR